MTRPALSVVVPTRNRPEMLRRALTSLRDALGPEDELLVVDSASDDPDATEQVAVELGARVVRCTRPGETVARNAGWQAAQHDLVAYCDDDVWVDRGWADAFARAIAADPRLAFVTGRVDIPPGQEVVGLAVSILDRPEPMTYDATTPGLLGHAASMVVRRGAVAAVGGFDELLGAGATFEAGPEGDLFDRLFAAGWLGGYEPAARAWHDQWRRRLRIIIRLDFGYGKGSGARLSKLVRAGDRSRARLVAAEYFWHWGLSQLPRHLRARDVLMVTTTVTRLAGVVVGVVRGLATPVRDGHFRSRRRLSSS